MFRTEVILGDPEKPATLRILECGDNPDPLTEYTITDPNNRAVRVQPGAGGLEYELPPGSPPGTYNVEIHSHYGTVSLGFSAVQDPNPHIYVHDPITGAPNPDPTHGVRVDYANFQPGSVVTVGLYRFEDIQPKLIDTWQFRVDNAGRYSEILAPPSSAEQGYVLMTCAVESCVPKNILMDASMPLVFRGFTFQAGTGVPSPADAVKNYYEAINNRQFDSSWGMLSPHFKDLFNRNPNGSYDFPGYENFWNSVASVELVGQNILSQTSSTATVIANLRYRMRDGRIINDEKPRITLIWDAASARWLFYDKGP